MRALAADFFARSPFMAGPLIATLLFAATFAAILVRVLRARPAALDDAARLPLGHDDVDRERGVR